MAVTNTLLVALTGATLFTDTDLAATVQGVKASSGTIYSIDIDNTANAAATFVKLWNVASGSVTVGTTAPDLIIRIPASVRVPINIPAGLLLDTAISIAAVTTAGTAGTTGPTSDVIARVVYV